MFKYILVLALLTVSARVNAQFSYDYTIVCDTTERLVKSLGIDYKERATWTGMDVQDKSRYSLWINERTGTWTLLKMTVEVSCILGVGNDSKLMLGDAV